MLEYICIIGVKDPLTAYYYFSPYVRGFGGRDRKKSPTQAQRAGCHAGIEMYGNECQSTTITSSTTTASFLIIIIHHLEG